MKFNAIIVDALKMEQYYIDTLNHNLNIDLNTKVSVTHTTMSEEAKQRLRNQRGQGVYIYNTKSSELIYYFESKQYLYNTLNIHHVTLNNCLENGTLWLKVFLLTLEPIEEITSENLIN